MFDAAGDLSWISELAQAESSPVPLLTQSWNVGCLSSSLLKSLSVPPSLTSQGCLSRPFTRSGQGRGTDVRDDIRMQERVDLSRAKIKKPLNPTATKPPAAPAWETSSKMVGEWSSSGLQLKSRPAAKTGKQLVAAAVEAIDFPAIDVVSTEVMHAPRPDPYVTLREITDVIQQASSDREADHLRGVTAFNRKPVLVSTPRSVTPENKLHDILESLEAFDACRDDIMRVKRHLSGRRKSYSEVPRLAGTKDVDGSDQGNGVGRVPGAAAMFPSINKQAVSVSVFKDTQDGYVAPLQTALLEVPPSPHGNSPPRLRGPGASTAIPPARSRSAPPPSLPGMDEPPLVKLKKTLKNKFQLQVEARVQELKKDPSELEALKTRLKDYREASRWNHYDAININIHQAFTLTPQDRLEALKARSRTHEARVKEVQRVARRRQDEMMTTRAVDAQAQEDPRKRAELRKLEAARWRMFGTLALLFKKANSLYIQSELQQRMQNEWLRSIKACIEIQSWWRMILAQRAFKRIQSAVRQIQSFVRTRRATEAKRSQRVDAATKILEFLKAVDSSGCGGLLSTALKSLQHGRVSVRRQGKDMNLVNSTRSLVLVTQWEIAEAKLIKMAKKQRALQKDNNAPKETKTAGTVPVSASKLADLMRARRAGIITDGDSSPKSADDGSSMPIFANDRILLDDLTPVPREVKGLVVRSYLKHKNIAYGGVLGLHWLDMMRYKRELRSREALTTAQAIVRGKGVQEELDAMEVSAAPSVPVFRPNASPVELKSIMQQGCFETALYKTYLQQQDLVEYRKALEADLHKRNLAAAGKKIDQKEMQDQAVRELHQSYAHKQAWEASTLHRIHNMLRRRFQALKINQTQVLRQQHLPSVLNDHILRLMLHGAPVSGEVGAAGKPGNLRAHVKHPATSSKAPAA